MGRVMLDLPAGAAPARGKTDLPQCTVANGISPKRRADSDRGLIAAPGWVDKSER
jgi:hypothetical protein